jgi:molybdate transport system substrate-binding protein
VRKEEAPLKSVVRTAALLLPALLLAAPLADAADKSRVKVFAALAVEAAFPEIEPMILASTGVDIEVEFAMAAAIVDRLNKGEAPDLVILTKEGMAGMAKAGAVGPATDLISTDIGIAVAEGAPLPVIETSADLAAFLKATPSVAYSRRGASGVHFQKLIDQLGLTDIVKPKAVVIDEGLTATRLLKGEVAAAVQQVAELRFGGAKQIVFLPKELQSHTVYSVAPLARSSRTAEQAAVIRALTSKAAAEAFERSGVHPVFEVK